MRDAMYVNGLPYSGELYPYTGKYYPFVSENGECKKKCCRYRIFPQQLGAHFVCWRRNISVIWFVKKPKQFTSNEVKIIHQERDQIYRKQQEKRKLLHCRKQPHTLCIQFLGKIIDYKNKSQIHPYTKRKKIIPYMSWGFRKFLIIPVLDINYIPQSIQFIYPNGFKHGKTGAPLSGNMIWLSKELPNNYAGIICVCEGWATGCTIREMISVPVICALNCHNLLKVILALVRRYPKAYIKICSDNDSGKSDNPGLVSARKVSLRTGVVLTYPIADDTKVTDFNDLFINYGGEEVRRQLALTRE